MMTRIPARFGAVPRSEKTLFTQFLRSYSIMADFDLGMTRNDAHFRPLVLACRIPTRRKAHANSVPVILTLVCRSAKGNLHA